MRIRPAKAELEAEATAAAQAQSSKRWPARKIREQPRATERATEGRPALYHQKDFTDPESRIMKSDDGFVQAYIAQAAVNGEAQIMVA